MGFRTNYRDKISEEIPSSLNFPRSNDMLALEDKANDEWT